MSSDIVAAQMSTKNITFSRAQSGWLFKEDKTVRKYILNCTSSINEILLIIFFIAISLLNILDIAENLLLNLSMQEMVGAFQANFYTIHGLTLESRKR